MLLKSVHLKNLLSYGDEALPVELGPLNVLIGTNGTGKTNLIESLELLRALSSDLSAAINARGGLSHWLWKGAAEDQPATLEMVVDYPEGRMPLRYLISFTEDGDRLQVVDEKVENEKPFAEFRDNPYFYYRLQSGSAVINALNVAGGEQEGGGHGHGGHGGHGGGHGYGGREPGRRRRLQHETVDTHASILAQYKDPEQCPELAYLDKMFGEIRIYREFDFGPDSAARKPQKADLQNVFLEPDGSNLGMVLSRLQGDSRIKDQLLGSLQALIPGIQGIHLQLEEGAVLVSLDEGRHTVPATHLSDATLRYLGLLSILCNSKPGRLVCIEQPELGLHPDVLPTLGALIMEASKRTQLLVTTQSDLLLDAFTSMPESVMVAENTEAGTQLKRVDPAVLKSGEDLKLGQLWMNGDLGGVRV